MQILKVFSAFYTGDLCRVTQSVPKNLWSFPVYRFSFPESIASCIDETTRHLTMRIKDHFKPKSKSTVLKHLKNCQIVKLSYHECYEITEVANSYRLKLKEVIEITWERPSLNKQKKSTYFYNWLTTCCLSDVHHGGKTVFEQRSKKL